ncbi:hypothetical protein [Nonomuraea sp. NPDC046570]|uniref:hypothetical protein n=1 Tax=Nonomuraea sp. NPDC046570 TaxID=3155255 RepID=UPI0033C0F150
MAFWSRLFKRGADDPGAEREQAHRQGMRDARQHALREFTDPEFQPVYLSEVRARARERIAHVDLELAATRTELLKRASEARETILRETGRADLRSAPPEDPSPNGHRPDGADPFISVAESRRRREDRRRHAALREASDTVQRARAHIEQLSQEWGSALLARDHTVEAVHAWAEQLIAAYRGGVMRAHPRREEIPSLWKSEVTAMDSTLETPTALSGRRELEGLLDDVEHRIEMWHADVHRLTRPEARPELPAGEHDTAREDDDKANQDNSGEGAR